VDVDQLAYVAGLLLIGSLLCVAVCFITLTWSSVQWASTEKDKAKRARAKKRIRWSLVALVVSFVTFIILTYIVVMLTFDELYYVSETIVFETSSLFSYKYPSHNWAKWRPPALLPLY
jgi:ABC-type Fe3+ transport system permease subunit